MDMPCRGKLLFYSALFFIIICKKESLMHVLVFVWRSSSGRFTDAAVFLDIYHVGRVSIDSSFVLFLYIFYRGKKRKKNNWVLEWSGKEIEKEENRSSRILVSSQRAAHRHRIIGHWLYLLTHFHVKLICSKKILLPNFTHKNNFSGIKLANEWAESTLMQKMSNKRKSTKAEPNSLLLLLS